MASIQKRTSKAGVDSWRVGYHEDRKLKWSPTFATAQGALEFKGLVERLGPEAALGVVQQRSGRDAHSGPPLLSEWLERHLEAVSASATPGTVADYRRMAARTWLPRLGPLPLDAISRTAVTQWVAWQRQQPTARGKGTYSPKSIANAQRFLSSVMQGAVDAELIDRNPARGISLPSDHERDDMIFLTENEYARLYAAVAPEYQPLVAILAGTGMRWGEATALQPEDFDLDAAQPIVRVSRAWKKGAQGVYLGSPKSKRGRRTITLPRAVVDVVRPLVEQARNGELVFTAREGGRIRAQNFHPRVWHVAIDKSGIGKRPRLHDLRHSHASWLIAAGVPLTVLQRRLGHESIKTSSDVYGHLTPDAMAGAALAAEIALSGAMPQIEA